MMNILLSVVFIAITKWAFLIAFGQERKRDHAWIKIPFIQETASMTAVCEVTRPVSGIHLQQEIGMVVDRYEYVGSSGVSL